MKKKEEHVEIEENAAIICGKKMTGKKAIVAGVIFGVISGVIVLGVLALIILTI